MFKISFTWLILTNNKCLLCSSWHGVKAGLGIYPFLRDIKEL